MKYRTAEHIMLKIEEQIRYRRNDMIRTEHECSVEYREHMRDGEGTVQITNFITGPEELNGKGRLFARITLNPGCSIGYHELTLWMPRQLFPSEDSSLMEIIYYDELQDILSDRYTEVW